MRLAGRLPHALSAPGAAKLATSAPVEVGSSEDYVVLQLTFPAWPNWRRSIAAHSQQADTTRFVEWSERFIAQAVGERDKIDTNLIEHTPEGVWYRRGSFTADTATRFAGTHLEPELGLHGMVGE